MKTKHYILLLFLFFVSNLIGQTEARLYKTIDSRNDVSHDEYRTHRITEYEYNYLGQITEKIIKYYNETGEVEIWWGNFYTYDFNANLIKDTYRRYNSEIGIWITIEWLDYIYNNNGCEIQKSKTENLGGLFSRVEYERNANCQITKETLYSKLTTSDDIRLVNVREVTFLQDGISYDEINYEASFSNGDLRLRSEIEYQFNEDELIENIYSTVQHTFGGYWYESNVEYIYDQQKNAIKHATSFKEDSNAEWVLEHEFVFYNEYDDSNRLVKRGMEKYIYPEPGGTPILDETFSRENKLDYLCSDLINQEDIDYSPDLSNFIYRTNYFYEGKDECFDFENVLLGMSVFPNPSAGTVTIESPIFQSGDTQIRVFDMSGKLLLEKNEIRREKTTTVDLSDFPNGMYMIQLMNQEHFTQSKVMILN